MQRQASSKEEVTGLGDTISGEVDRVLRSDADTMSELKRISDQIDELRSQLADTNYSISQLSQRIAATNQELKTVRTLIQRPVIETPELPPIAPGSDPEEIYESAYNDYLRGNYDLALIGFRQYVETFPTTELADNALYWIGECYFVKDQFREAIQEYSRVENEYPSSERIASTILRKGLAFLELGDIEQGEALLRSVVERYPRSDEAILARQRLESNG